MYRTIIVPLDGSTFAEQAVATAAEIAKQSAADLVLARVHESYLYESTDYSHFEDLARQDQETYLAETAEHVERRYGIQAERMLLSGAVAPAICDLALATEAPLIVLSTHGRTGFSRLWLGSVADTIARSATTPVLMLRHRGQDAGLEAPPHRFERALIPLDGSEFAENALPHALALVESYAVQLRLLRVVAPISAPTPLYAAPYLPVNEPTEESLEDRVTSAEGYVDAIAARVRRDNRALDLVTDVRVAESPATAILEAVSAHDVDTVVLATHGRGLSRLVIASVADKILRGGPDAVIVVRPPAA